MAKELNVYSYTIKNFHSGVEVSKGNICAIDKFQADKFVAKLKSCMEHHLERELAFDTSIKIKRIS